MIKPMEHPTVTYQLDGAIALIGLDRPAKRNALSDAMVEELRVAVLRAGSEAKVGIIFGHGDHFSAGLESYRIADIHSYLDQRDIAYRDYPSGKDLNVTDPDGIHVQLSADNTWSQLQGGTASPESGESGAEPVFRPTGLDHILLNVSDPEKSTAFYEKIFGSVTQRNNNRIWFQAGRSRIGLLQAPSGQRPGVNHFCVSAAAFDYTTAMKKLAESNAHVEKAEIAGAPEFRDLDGLLVQVMTPK